MLFCTMRGSTTSLKLEPAPQAEYPQSSYSGQVVGKVLETNEGVVSIYQELVKESYYEQTFQRLSHVKHAHLHTKVRELSARRRSSDCALGYQDLSECQTTKPRSTERRPAHHIGQTLESTAQREELSVTAATPQPRCYPARVVYWWIQAMTNVRHESF